MTSKGGTPRGVPTRAYFNRDIQEGIRRSCLPLRQTFLAQPHSSAPPFLPRARAPTAHFLAYPLPPPFASTAFLPLTHPAPTTRPRVLPSYPLSRSACFRTRAIYLSAVRLPRQHVDGQYRRNRQCPRCTAA